MYTPISGVESYACLHILSSVGQVPLLTSVMPSKISLTSPAVHPLTLALSPLGRRQEPTGRTSYENLAGNCVANAVAMHRQ